ncbi:MAG: outer membrane beta-barrel protein [Acidobacteriota bacterium]
MHRRLFTVLILCMILGSTGVFAQENKFEIYGLLGYTFSEGVDIQPEEEDDLGIDRLSPNSAFSYGLGMDFLITENFGVGFNFAQEKSKLRARVEGFQGLDITDMDVNNFHGILSYTFGDEDASFRPFVFGGLGATSYSPDSFEERHPQGFSRFSTTWGGGVKYFTTDHLGFRGGVRWTPTHINSDPAGIWCDPWWPWYCWQVSTANYSHQFEMSVGVVTRF